jgi:hypothetical protein
MDISVGCPVSLKQEWPLRVKAIKIGSREEFVGGC